MQEGITPILQWSDENNFAKNLNRFEEVFEIKND